VTIPVAFLFSIRNVFCTRGRRLVVFDVKIILGESSACRRRSTLGKRMRPCQSQDTGALNKSNMWFVYILRCSDKSLYTGVTTDVKRRSEQHNAGTASRYTRSHLPVCVEYHEPYVSQSLALKRELAIKAMTRLQKESLIRQAAQLEQPR
jgi:predicted GIY-YIG superfamily endonuclease